MNDEKAKRLKALMDELMSEMADEVVDDQMLELIEKNLRKNITAVGLIYSVASVKLFLAGFEFCMQAFGNMGPQGAAPVFMGIQKIRKALEAPGLKAIEDAMNRKRE